MKIQIHTDRLCCCKGN